MASTNVRNYYKGTIFINYKQNGWSESIDFIAANDAAATLVLQKYAQHRQWTLPLLCSIVYGRVAYVPLQRYSIPLAGAPFVGKAASLTTANTNPPNDAMVAPCMSFIAEEGKHSIRFFRGVPDDIILNMALVPTPPDGSWVDLVVDPGDGSANPATWDVAFKNVLSYIAQKTVLPSKAQMLIVDVLDEEGYRLRPFTGILSRDARKKSTGRPFGMSRGRAMIA